MKYQHSKKKKYHLKKLPIILISIAIVAVLCVVFALLFRKPDAVQTNGGMDSSIISSQISSEESSSEPVPAEESEKEAPSSHEHSSLAVSSTQTPSATTSSKPKPSSTPPVSSQAPVSSAPVESIVEEAETPEGELPQGNLSDWNLILLNPSEENKIEKDLSFQKTKFDSQYVDSRAAQAYTDMYNAAKKEGITLFLRSGYRSMKTQGVNYNANVQRLIKAGNSEEEAIRQTQLYYTVPGHSEHHSGLAFDIITPEYHKNVYTLNEKFASTDAYQWLTAHCAEYGFVLRYAKEKQSITTINFEPWHYRYVGKQHAKYITENNLCLEEYIALLKENGR